MKLFFKREASISNFLVPVSSVYPVFYHPLDLDPLKLPCGNPNSCELIEQVLLSLALRLLTPFQQWIPTSFGFI